MTPEDQKTRDEFEAWWKQALEEYPNSPGGDARYFAIVAWQVKQKVYKDRGQWVDVDRATYESASMYPDRCEVRALGVIPLRAAPIAPTKVAEPVAGRWEAIHEVLKNFRLTYWCDEDGEGLPLVDHLCRPKAKDISEGASELAMLCDDIVAAITAYPIAPAVAVAEPLTDAQIIALTEDLDCDHNGWAIRWVRAIEVAHGIVPKTLEV